MHGGVSDPNGARYLSGVIGLDSTRERGVRLAGRLVTTKFRSYLCGIRQRFGLRPWFHSELKADFELASGGYIACEGGEDNGQIG